MIDSCTSKNPKGDVSVYEPLLKTITVNFVFNGKDRTVLLHMVEKSCLISMFCFFQSMIVFMGVVGINKQI